jgi:acyl carrier protein
MTEDPRLASVKDWLLSRKPELSNLDPDFDLIENRVIDSLSFLELVFFLEELTGRELKVTAETVNAFRSLHTIQKEIFDANGSPQ